VVFDVYSSTRVARVAGVEIEKVQVGDAFEQGRVDSKQQNKKGRCDRRVYVSLEWSGKKKNAIVGWTRDKGRYEGTQSRRWMGGAMDI